MKNRKGFTLIELMVVVVIMGILATMGIPYYYKTVETSKATDALSLGHLLANANRMYKVDHPVMTQWLSGQITNTCNNVSTCAGAGTTGCALVACGYVAQQDWDQSAYNFFICNGASGGYCNNGVSASVKRKTGTYVNWGYRFLDTGVCQSLGGAPACPQF